MLHTRLAHPIAILLAAVLLASTFGAPAAHAQTFGGARTLTALNLRQGPSLSHAVITTLPRDTRVQLTGRSGSALWVYGQTTDGRFSGWLMSLYLEFDQLATPLNLPVRAAEIVTLPTPAPTPVSVATNNSLPLPVYTGYDPARVTGIDLNAYPILPENMGRAHAIFLAGQQQGRSSHAVAKVGDCASAHPDFLAALVYANRNLGAYADALLPVIDHFADSLGAHSQAAHAGFNASVITDTIWANPEFCAPTETPLACEIRRTQPAIAVIMFGTTDLQTLSPEQYDTALRTVLDETIRAGVIPVLSTFPPHLAFPAESVLYNQIVVRIALDYDIPLINLWLALQALPNSGMAPDGTHLGEPAWGGPGFLVPQNLIAGLPVHNLVTIQALDVIWRGVMW